MQTNAIWMIMPGAQLPDLEARQNYQQIQERSDTHRVTLPGWVEVVGDTALVPIQGVICRKDWWGTDCEAVSRALRMIAERPDVSTVVLDIDSPGGLAWGVPETADAILAVRAAGKRVLAWIDPLGASAAYWLAAAADAIYALPSGLVGSIGAVRAFYDYSAMLAEAGISLEAFTSDAEGKIRGMMGRKITDEDRAVFQDSVDEAGTMFRDFVTTHRPPLGSLAFSGDVWSGRKALEMGLVDGLAPDLGTALAMFRAGE